MRVPRLPAAALSVLLLTGAVAGCSDDPADTPGGGSVQEPGQQEQAPAVEDGTGEDEEGDSTTGDAEDVEPTSSG